VYIYKGSLLRNPKIEYTASGGCPNNLATFTSPVIYMVSEQGSMVMVAKIAAAGSCVSLVE
jgi:hypothetical protein